MKSQTFFSILSSLFLLLSTFVSAWPGALEARPGSLAARQNTDSAQPTSTAPTEKQSSVQSSVKTATSTEKNTSDDNKSTDTQKGSAAASTQSGSNPTGGSAARTGSAAASTITSGSGSGSGNKYSNSTSVAIDPRLPPGGVSMITPAATDGMTFVKVGDYVTFIWNYTSLSVTPSYIDVIATNTVNSQTYTIAGNMSTDQTQTVVWDTSEYTQTADLPFVIATYTLMVYDAASDPTAAPQAGYLAAFQNFQFGVYTPQPYTPLNEFRCATCNGAMSANEKQALKVILGTCTLTILSFTWFASGLFHLF